MSRGKCLLIIQLEKVIIDGAVRRQVRRHVNDHFAFPSFRPSVPPFATSQIISVKCTVPRSHFLHNIKRRHEQMNSCLFSLCQHLFSFHCRLFLSL
ncbi:hypothetical protein RvY_02658 [Ramazzottius varieornatus]|uniref:Uncharacterized protein n=1 Tax=Ramazzottius varieornatus TaxID=947166 RepID=A0A1D1USK1_RAMVA|nr:hypothetical protein RvY_02658 [Ramazzottius varieornatus]